MYLNTLFFSELFAGKHRRGHLVTWVEKANIELIGRLLEITKMERNQKLLLSARNLQELGASPFPYIVPIIPCPLPAELVKGEYFVLAGLFKSIPGGYSQAGSTREPQYEIEEGALARFFRLAQLPLAERDS